MRRYVPIMLCAGLSTVASADQNGFATSQTSVRSLSAPSTTDTQVDLTDSAVDPARNAHSYSDASLRISTVSPALGAEWVAKSERELNALEDSLAGFGNAPTGSSNQLGGGSGSIGLHPNSNNMHPATESFTKTTVIPLPTAGLLGAGGLVIVGLGRRRR